MKRMFPIFVDIKDRKILIIGAGKVAKRRINTLLQFECEITIIAKKIDLEFKKFLTDEKISFIEKEFEEKDITDDIFICIAATDDKDTNNHIYDICKIKKIPVNDASDKTKCDFYFPAVALGENITIGITGNGENHTSVAKTAKKIRSMIND